MGLGVAGVSSIGHVPELFCYLINLAQEFEAVHEAK